LPDDHVAFGNPVAFPTCIADRFKSAGGLRLAASQGERWAQARLDK
jgi:hypothetical protein